MSDWITDKLTVAELSEMLSAKGVWHSVEGSLIQVKEEYAVTVAFNQSVIWCTTVGQIRRGVAEEEAMLLANRVNGNSGPLKACISGDKALATWAQLIADGISIDDFVLGLELMAGALEKSVGGPFLSQLAVWK